MSGSAFFHGVLRAAVDRYPDVLGEAGLAATPREFKHDYDRSLIRFEALRVPAAKRVEIARFMLSHAQGRLSFSRNGSPVPLREHLAAPCEPAAIEEIPTSAGARWQPRVPYAGRCYIGAEIAELSERLLAKARLTRAAAAGLDWIARASGRETIDLSGQKFVVMGAGAEIAPTELLLAAGASVLWVDISDPTHLLQRSSEQAGRLFMAMGARDLLAEPERISATIARFAGDDPVHLGLFAYAPGQSREWRLAASMNAIALSLAPERVRSISLFISPTAPSVVQAEDREASRARHLTGWQSTLCRLRLLDASGPYEHAGVSIARSIVPLQGLSYQAAQYVSKILLAETCAIHGMRPESDRPEPVTVSANVAGVTATRSMSHPLFRAAFLGAPYLGLEVFEPETTRAISGLLVLHDLLNPDAPGNAAHASSDHAKRTARLFSQQIHGGMFSVPFAVEPALRVAAAIGLAKRPRLMRGFF